MSETKRIEESHRRIGRIELQVVAGPDRGLRVPVDAQRIEQFQAIRGGRSAVNDIVLTDEHVSDVHFEIVLRPDAVILRDLDSTNGVKVHGLRVREVWLTPNVVFQAGQSHIALEVADSVEVSVSPHNHFAELHGRSLVMRELFARMEKIAARLGTPLGERLQVLVTGETGTGKELVARGLHERSTRRGGPFVVRDCATIPPALAESALFGHAAGSFTDAKGARSGCFEDAQGGTLFLDEIGELPLDVQPKLLRVLQEKVVIRVGETTPRKVDVRVLCATHRDLQRMVGDGKFRQDLYYRLAGLQLHLPSLRERGDDLSFLAELFQRRAAEEMGVTRTLSVDAQVALRAHGWPGNVRELKSVIDRAMIMADGDTLEASDLWPRPGRDSAIDSLESLFHRTHGEAVAEFERRYFEIALARHPTKVRAAEAAGMTAEGLRQALKRLARPVQDAGAK